MKHLFFNAFLFILVVSVAPHRVAAQENSAEAQRLLVEAMEAYADLKLDEAKQAFNKALALAAEGLDRDTLADLYLKYGAFWIGGFVENQKGLQCFLIALCIDDSVKLEAKFYTPGIELLFRKAQSMVNATQCQEVLEGVVLPEGLIAPGQGESAESDEGLVREIHHEGESTGVPPIPACGWHRAPKSQRQQHELPIHIIVNRHYHEQIGQVVAHYAFDNAQGFKQLILDHSSTGYGKKIDCDKERIGSANPSIIAYYIELYDHAGNRMCTHGSREIPFRVMMIPEADPLGEMGGMVPKKCEESSFDGKRTAKPLLGEPCLPAIGCAAGLVCGKLEMCVEPDDEQAIAKIDDSELPATEPSPSRVYINVSAGVGVGYLKQEQSFSQWTQYADKPYNVLEPVRVDSRGAAWSGMPIRAALGVRLTERLSLEVGGRFDAKPETTDSYISCWDAYRSRSDVTLGQVPCDGPLNHPDVDLDEFDAANPQSTEASRQIVLAAQRSVAHRDSTLQQPLTESVTRYAWMVNLRARYALAQTETRLGRFDFSAIAGVGYGHAAYRVKVSGLDNKSEDRVPKVGWAVIELGPAMAYRINNHFNLFLDLPFDLILGDGFAVNADINLGLGVGF